MCTAEAAVSAEQLCLERELNLEHGKHEPCEPVEEHSGKQLVMFPEWICFSQQGEQRTIIPQVDWLWIKNNLLFSSKELKIFIAENFFRQSTQFLFSVLFLEYWLLFKDTGMSKNWFIKKKKSVLIFTVLLPDMSHGKLSTEDSFFLLIIHVSRSKGGSFWGVSGCSSWTVKCFGLLASTLGNLDNGLHCWWEHHLPVLFKL